MTDVRLGRLADVLVNYSLQVKKGDWVGIFGSLAVLPLVRAAYREVLEAGGHPVLMLRDEASERALVRYGSDEQLDWIDPSITKYYDEADAYIRIEGVENTRAMTNIPVDRLQRWRSHSGAKWVKTRLERDFKGEFPWVVTRFPTQADAQEANMSLDEYEDFIYSATFCDQDDPVQNWRRLHTVQQSKVDWLAGKRELVCKGPDIDLTLSIDGRPFINCSGEYNMPDGEIFTGPVENSVNGWVRFRYPSNADAKSVSGIQLKFEDGKVVQASADTNEALLHAKLDVDAGARHIGEFAIGTNLGIQQFTGNTLFDEKIAGTIHMALGAGYAESGSKNKSKIHWDLVCDMRTDSEITVDGELFYKNGDFVI